MKKLFIILTVAILYFLFGNIKLESVTIHKVIIPTIFASEGIALAFAIYFGRWVSIGVFIGQFFLAYSNHAPIGAAFLIALTNSFEAFLGATLFYKFNINKNFTTFKDFLKFSLLVTLILQPISAIFSNLALLIFGVISKHEFFETTKSWWFSNVLAQLLFTPAIILFFEKKSKILELLLIGVISSLAIFGFIYIFDINSSLLTLSITLPLIILIVYKKDLSYALFTLILISYILFFTISQNFGPFVNNTIDYNLFVLVSIITLFITSAILNSHKAFESKLQEEIQKALEKNKTQQFLLMQQNRLAQMGEMINMIAHQWRQPLNNLSILNQLLISKYNNNSLDREFLKYFEENSTSQITLMSKTIDDFKDFFKPKEKLNEFALIDVVNKTLSILKNTFDYYNIKVDIKKDNDIVCRGYPNSLGHAILNILTNAKDALVEREVVDKKITIELMQDNEVIIKIKDNAGGIEDDILDKIFDPYFSTKISKNGTGLGLYMSKMIIEHMRGKIDVENDKEGAIFTIRLNPKDCSKINPL